MQLPKTSIHARDLKSSDDLAGEKTTPGPQCHLVKQMAEEEYLREKMIYGKESHLLFFAARQKDRWTSASK